MFDDEQTRYSNIPTKHHTKKSKLLLKRPLYTYTGHADNIFKALLKNAICPFWQFFLLKYLQYDCLFVPIKKIKYQFCCYVRIQKLNHIYLEHTIWTEQSSSV